MRGAVALRVFRPPTGGVPLLRSRFGLRLTRAFGAAMVESPPLPYTEHDDVVFTSYFTSQANPQKNANGETLYAPKDSIQYIYPWYATVCHLGLSGVVIHDGLSPAFIEAHKRPNVQFVEHKLNGFSLNDERYFALRDILARQRFGRVMMTDGSDLLFKKNPFEFMTEDQMYFGSDEPTAPRIRDNPWCVHKLMQLHEAGRDVVEIQEGFLDFEYINAGVVAGSYENMKQFMESLTLLFEMLGDQGNHNMMAINYLLWKFGVKHFKGAPLTSPFKRFELHGDYFIVHK